jgi:hypothetical protein
MYIVLAYCNNNPRTDMLLHSDTLSWFRASQSLHSPEFSKYNFSCLWFDPTKGSNSKSTASDAIILTITPPIVSIFAQCVRSLDLATHTSLSPIRHGFAYQLLAHGRWFSPGTPESSTTKTGRHDIAEILLKVALKHQKSIKIKCFSGCQNIDTIGGVMVSMIASDAW